MPTPSASRRSLACSSALLGAACGLFLTLAPLATATITVNASTAVRTVDERVFGLNTAIWDSYCNTTQTISLLSAAGIRMLRFPGGSASDEYHWETGTSLDYTWQWATDTDDFINVAKNTSAQVVMTANYGTGTPAEAAAWVTYCNVTKSAGFKYWEIGNENYGTWETDDQDRPNDPYTYATRAKDYIAAMKAADATIKIGVVVVAGEDENVNYTDHPATNSRTGTTHNGWTPVLLATLKSLGVTPDFVAYHRYDGAPGSESDSALLQKASTWTTDITAIRQQLTDYLGTAGAGVEILATENNSVYANPGKQTTSLVNALYLADSIGNILKTECNGLLWWDLRNGQEASNNLSTSLYGWRQYGDYGILSSPSSVTGGSATAYDCYPSYYAFKLLSKFARSGDTIVSTTSTDSLLSAFACLRTDGTLRLMVINKSPSATTSSPITISGFTPASSATTYTFGITEDNVAKAGSSTDITTASISNAAASFTTSFAPYSITVISFTNGTGTGTGSSGGSSSGSGSSSSGGGALPFALAGVLAGAGLLRRVRARG